MELFVFSLFIWIYIKWSAAKPVYVNYHIIDAKILKMTRYATHVYFLGLMIASMWCISYIFDTVSCSYEVKPWNIFENIFQSYLF